MKCSPRLRTLCSALAYTACAASVGCATSASDQSTSPTSSEAAAQSGPPEGMTAEEIAQIEAKMAEAAQPGAQHELLKKLAGDWDMESTFSMGPESMVSTASVHAEMILGGRFLVQTTTGSEGPMKMDAFTIMGFDRRHKAFTIYGCDTMGTYCIGAEGPWDPATKTMTMYGEDDDTSSGVLQKYDIVVKFLDDNRVQTQVIFKPGVFGNAEPMIAATSVSTRRG